MIDKNLIQRKLAKMSEYLTQLEVVASKSLDEYKEDHFYRYSTERLIQLIVECAIDINNHIVVESEKKPPEDYRSSFSGVSRLGVITQDLLDKIKGSASLRNILVHDYMDIDDDIVYQSIPQTVSSYHEYMRQVFAFLVNES